MISVPVQVNGRTKGSIELADDATETDARLAVAADAVLGPITRQEKKFLYVPGKVINVIVGYL